MAQITLRGMDPKLEQEIRKIAHKSGKSLNRVILEMIYRYTGFEEDVKRRPAEPLRDLAGGWSEKDALEFMESIKLCRQIDEEMWI